MTWLAIARARFSQMRHAPTDETDERGVSTVLSVPSGCVPDFSKGVSSVSSVGVTGLSENCISMEELLAAAMRACDAHGDGEAAREAMRADVMATPPELRDDLLAHFLRTYGPAPEDCSQPL